MLGLMLYPNGAFRLQEVVKPEIGRNVFSPHDVPIKVAYCGIKEWKNYAALEPRSEVSWTEKIFLNHNIEGIERTTAEGGIIQQVPHLIG